MRWLALTLILTLPGCDWMDVAEGKAPASQEHVLRIAALEAEMEAIKRGTVADGVFVEPQVAAIHQPAPEPSCIPVFRVTTCP